MTRPAASSPPTTTTRSIPTSQGSYLNAKNVKYNPNNFINAALAGIGDGHNGGGPIWAIFDADAVTREKWDPTPPNVDIEAGFFFSADTLGDLAKKIEMKYQRVPMPPENLEQTVARYNSFVDSGVDEDFGKPKPLYKIAKPPFYAAWATPVVHDTRAGLRINAKCQVMDMNGKVIAGPLLRRRIRRRLQPARPRPRHLPGLYRRQERSQRTRASREHRITSFELLMPTLWCSPTAVASTARKHQHSFFNSGAYGVFMPKLWHWAQ